MSRQNTIARQISAFLERGSGWLILLMVVVTGLLVIPMVTMPPEQDASDNPGGPVYDLQDLINTQLPPRVHGPFFIMEALNGDVLTRKPLLELYQNTENLRLADRLGELHPPGLPKQPYLYNGFDSDRQVPVIGIFTVADAVQEALSGHPMLNTGLEEATEDGVKLARTYARFSPGGPGDADGTSYLGCQNHPTCLKAKTMHRLSG